MNESLGLLIKVVDGFGFLCEHYGLDLVRYGYDRRSYSNFVLHMESNSLLLRLTLEKGQLYIHAASPHAPDEWHSLQRVLRVVVRHGCEFTPEELNCDYWRQGRGLDTQFALAGRQLERVLQEVSSLMGERDFEPIRQELRSFARPRTEEF